MRTVSSKFFDTQVTSIFTEKLVFPRHARCVLSHPSCNGHSLLLNSIFVGLAESKILLVAPADTRPKTLLIPFCTVQLRTLRPSLFGDSLFLYDLWSRPWRDAQILGLHGLSPCPHPLERGGSNNNSLLVDHTIHFVLSAT